MICVRRWTSLWRLERSICAKRPEGKAEWWKILPDASPTDTAESIYGKVSVAMNRTKERRFDKIRNCVFLCANGLPKKALGVIIPYNWVKCRLLKGKGKICLIIALGLEIRLIWE